MKKSKLGFGLILGTIIGGAAAFFLTPKTGKENRELAAKKWSDLHTALKTKSKDEIIKEIFGTISKTGKALYEKAQKELNLKLDELKKDHPEIDHKKYTKVVGEVVDRLKDEKDASKENLAQLKDFLVARWDYVTKEGKKDIKKVTKKAK